MDHFEIYHEIGILIVMCVVVSLILNRFRLPAVAGVIATGAIAGPHGMGWLKNVKIIETLAEIGVVLLLFTIGLEFSLRRLRQIAKFVAIGGCLQVGLTVLAIAFLSYLLGASLRQSFFFGFITSLSSTAIVLRALSDRGELNAPHGRFIVGVLIFQDLAVLPMVMTIPFLSTTTVTGGFSEVLFSLGKMVAVLGLTVLIARYLVAHVFDLVDASRSREVFLLAVVGTCMAIAWVTTLAGLSLALGAFLAGFILADSDYGERALGEILPIRYLLSSIFFASLGMLFDPALVLKYPGVTFTLFSILFFGKGFIATLAAIAMRFPARAAWLAGVGLAQFGEFGFVLAEMGVRSKLIQPEMMNLILAAGVLTMFLTPIALKIAPHITAGELLLRPLERLLGVQGIDEPAEEHQKLEDHIVVVGYGIAGQSLTSALRSLQFPYLIVELNSETVKKARGAGEPAYYGDVTSREALAHARVDHARAIVLIINDPDAARRAILSIRQFSRTVPIFIRCRYLSDGTHLMSLGATDVIVEEVEAGKETVSRVLQLLGAERRVNRTFQAT